MNRLLGILLVALLAGSQASHLVVPVVDACQETRDCCAPDAACDETCVLCACCANQAPSVTTCVPAQPLIVAVSHAVPMPHPLALPLLPADIQHVPRSL